MSRNKYKYNYIYLIYDIKYDKFYIGKKVQMKILKIMYMLMDILEVEK